MTELEKKIIEGMKKTGFSLEILAGSQFSNRGWSVRHQSIYHDVDENKSRYSDFIAHKVIDREKGFSLFKRLNWTVIAECKKSDKPWIFYSPPSDILTKDRALSTVFYTKVESEPALLPKQILPLFVDNHYFLKGSVDRIAQSAYVLFDKGKKSNERKGEKGYDQVFTATNQVLKALIFQRGSLKRNIKSTLVKNILLVFYAVIILEGKMFEYTLDEAQEPKLTEKTYLKYRVNFLDSPNSDPEVFIIDVITLEKLPEYAMWLEEEMAKVAKKT
jgi:hypothetical protein